MSTPTFPLGVELMDEDHAEIERMLAATSTLADAELPRHLAACRAEIAAHFHREEELMHAHNVPVLHCHIAQHNRMIEDIDSVIAAPADVTRLRTYLTRDLPNLVMAHITSVDQISARFLKGDLPPEMVAHLRLPEAVGP